MWDHQGDEEEAERKGKKEGKVKQKQQIVQKHGSMKEYGTQDAAKRLL